MPTYRFLDGMGDVVAERDLPDHAAALAWASGEAAGDEQDGDTDHDDGGDDDDDEDPAEVTRVEFLGPDGDWRWAGALQG